MPPLLSQLYEDSRALSGYLLSQREVSFRSQFDDSFKKVLLLAAASNLEYQVVNILTSFVTAASHNCEPLISFVDKAAIRRRYHTYFDWESRSANKFFNLFGDNVATQIKRDRESDASLDSSVRAFMELGSIRNDLVHNDYASFTLGKTTDEVFELYEASLVFMSYLSDTLARLLSQRGK